MIIGTWGVGPSFRTRVLSNMKEHPFAKYVILTDNVEEFSGLPGILGVFDIFELMDKYNTSPDEFIPRSKFEPDYAIEFKKNIGRFSYNARRFLFDCMLQLNILEFVIMDPDVCIHDENITTPVNTVSGRHVETIRIEPESEKFKYSRGLGLNESMNFINHHVPLLYLVKTLLGSNYKRELFSLRNLPLTEGPVRVYNFDSLDRLRYYLEVWNSCMSVILSPDIRKDEILTPIRTLAIGPGYMTSDYVPFIVANIFTGLSVDELTREQCTISIHFEDRYFSPSCMAKFVVTDDMNSFFEHNKQLIEKMISDGAWPHRG
jgi:hypothetical protein